METIFIYVISQNNRILLVSTSSGHVYSYSGNGTPGDVNGFPPGAEWYQPLDIIFDTYFYIADSLNNQIRDINPAVGANAFAFCGQTSGGSGWANGSGGIAAFSEPAGIVLAGYQFYYIADSLNNAIRKIYTGDVSTIVGGPGFQGAVDGGPSVAKINNPLGLALSADGNYLWFVDNNNQTIRRINLSNTNVETIAGLAGANGTQDGDGSSARFWQPIGIAVVGNVIFVADMGNFTIRKIEYK